GMRHIAEKLIPSQLSGSGLAKLRALTALLAGIIVVGASATFLLMVWPNSRWVGSLADLASPRELALVALANSLVIVAAYLAVAAAVWA
ncbi:hypothetical protein ABI013_15270, partial [Enterococcus faecium]|uniref:hypothetical protein n=1 Tax=Enterococcus faecium TaxID=1352 RepID=UPI003F441B2C